MSECSHWHAEEKRLVKVRIGLDVGSWHGYAAEFVWAEPKGCTVLIRNIPFYAHGISYDDEFSVALEDDFPSAKEKVASGGHSTYRVFVKLGQESHAIEYWKNLEDLGCTYERATEHLIAIDVPPTSDVRRVYTLLKNGESTGVWDFEEGNYAGADIEDA